ncbi:hypothetical protein O1L60_43695 [Streptomyces diastatochromogenes]|nr:hypothetical protein [Streptomyces diastatochromogenes]
MELPRGGPATAHLGAAPGRPPRGQRRPRRGPRRDRRRGPAGPSARTAARPPVRRLRFAADAEEVRRAAALLAGARLPVVVAGGGCKPADAGAAVRHLAELLGAPVFTTAAGRGVLDEEHPLACGLVGLYTTPPADRLLADADVVLAIGSRLEETARMGWDGLDEKRLVHVDVDPAVFLTALEPEVALLGDAALVAGQLAAALESDPPAATGAAPPAGPGSPPYARRCAPATPPGRRTDRS